MLASIYLTGDSVNARDFIGELAARDWRSIAVQKLETHGLRVVNPLELAWSMQDNPEAIEISDSANKKVRRALDLIDECDALLANVERSSYGTAMEMFYAYRRGKMVTVIGPSPYSPWVVSHSQARFNDIDRAVNYLIDKHPHAAPLSWALQYEAQLSERYEQMPPSGEPDYKFLGGSLPVLVVAPHSTAYWREGEFKSQDSFTGSLASILNRLAGCHSIMSSYCCAADPCWYLETPFRRALTDIIKAGKVGLVVMLLGSSWEEAPGLQVSSYGPTEESCHPYINLITEKLSKLEPVVPGSFDHPVRPLALFIAEVLSVPTIIVRLHKRYRMPRLQPQPFSTVSASLSEFVSEIGVQLVRSQA